jgi:DNA mismatch repair protein MutS
MFRLGDFYESFDDDAKIVSSVCNIVLTGRDMGTDNRVPLAGVPYHAVQTYLAKLIQAGHKVAIVEQTSDEVVNGLMTREVTRVVNVNQRKTPPVRTPRSFPCGWFCFQLGF